ncbi:hypothetical protein BC827DRAFT_781238 [Russula dissimulans]|nr:hypothetical protein BC827DRAFT_781238 [Russula dissimulans]
MRFVSSRLQSDVGVTRAGQPVAYCSHEFCTHCGSDSNILSSPLKNRTGCRFSTNTANKEPRTIVFQTAYERTLPSPHGTPMSSHDSDRTWKCITGRPRGDRSMPSSVRGAFRLTVLDVLPLQHYLQPYTPVLATPFLSINATFPVSNSPLCYHDIHRSLVHYASTPVSRGIQVGAFLF